MALDKLAPMWSRSITEGDRIMEMQSKEVVQKQNRRKQKGVTIVEYVIMLAVVAIAVALASPSIKNSVLSVFNRASSVMLQSY